MQREKLLLLLIAFVLDLPRNVNLAFDRWTFVS